MRDAYSPQFEPEHPTLFWDGDCGFCRHSVEWIFSRDRKDVLRAMPYQLGPNPPITAEVARACDKSVHLLLPDGQMLTGGRAVMQALKLVGWRLIPAIFSVPPFSWGLELGYKVVAKNRLLFSRLLFPRASSGDKACSVPKD